MDKDFESELKGSLIEATAAKAQIAKYFKRYGESGHEEAKKYQLIFASKIMCIIAKCDNKYLDVYCTIITEIFADRLCPEAGAKYWTLYVNCMRYFHYLLVEKKDCEKASLIYKHISSYSNKLQNAESSIALINIYCNHLFLQNSLKCDNRDRAMREGTDVVERLTKVFKDVLYTNTKFNFQYPDVLKKTISWLFPQSKAGLVYQFLKMLPKENVEQMFQALFTLYGSQTIDIQLTSGESNVQEHAKFIIETIYTLLQVDIMDKMQLQLSVQLLDNCRTECRLQNNKAIAESFHLLYDYMKLLCAQEPTSDFQRVYVMRCERFKELFEKYSKSIMHQPWFSDFLVLIFYLHSQLQSISLFSCFWKQMQKPTCFESMFKFFVEVMKLAPCISAETKLFTTNCCTSTRKHVILSFAQIVLASFVLYCQNVSETDEHQENMESDGSNLKDYYKEAIQNNVVLIINHAFKIIDKMDCITSDSQEIDILLTRFKQATLSCKTYKQAATCVSIFELFLKIKTKIASKEWPLLLRRLYKTITPLQTRDTPNIGREIQMCYIASLLQHDTANQIDISQIRTQISIFYATKATQTPTNATEQHEHCLLQLYNTTNLLLRPHLETSRKKLLHWLESQHILKYYKSNTALLHSILKYSQSCYDFVLITKSGKLQTYAMAKISSLYKSLKSKAKEAGDLSRLEQLTYGHVCVMLLNDMNANQKFQIDSKDLNEENLENLFLREEMSLITICNDLKRFNLAREALKAFEYFYEKFDSEIISMDDAIIDWESLLDDIGSLALSFQLFGYLEQSSHAWFLHYKCSRLIRDDFSSLRGLAFFCEYSEQCEKNTSGGLLNLEEELQCNFPIIIQSLEKLSGLQRHTHQTYILLAVLQMSHYYARSSRLSFAQMLLQYVEQRHAELTERQGRYDIVLATRDAIKFRLLWKHYRVSNVSIEEKSPRTTAENLLLHRCLLHEVEETLDHFYNFSYISSCDGLLYSILIINLVQELAECTVNRLCDNFINSLFIATCKCTLLLGLSLRFVQVMSMWMWVNLQMEYVDKAQVKLKIIEYVMGLKDFKDVTREKCKKPTSGLLPISCSELAAPNHHNPGVEAIRKLAQVHLSPIKTDKLQLSPSHRNSDLKRYFKCNIDIKVLPQNEQIEWTFFVVGCLNARLCFLVEDYDQLEAFYERGSCWLQMRQNSFNRNYYKNMQLMSMQHYANFLRARGKYDKALQCLCYGIELCENKKFYIDAVYYVNFQLQLIATQKELSGYNNTRANLPTHSKLRRALQFNLSPENIQQQHIPTKMELKENKYRNEMTSTKKSSAVMKPLYIYVTDSSCSSSKKKKTEADVGGSNLYSKKTKPKPKFEICEDYFEIMEVADNLNNVNAPDNTKSIKRTKIVEEKEKIYKTPKVAKKTSSSSTKNRGTELKPEFYIDINLADSPSSSLRKTSALPSPVALDIKENLNTNELVAKMGNLEIKGSKTTMTTEIESKTAKIRRKAKATKEPATVTIVLEDSPCTVSSATQKKFLNKPKESRTRAAAKVKTHSGQSTNEDILASSSRPRRQRKCVLDNNAKPTEQNATPLTCSTTATPNVTKRRQKENNLF